MTGRARLLNMCCLSVLMAYACTSEELPPYGAGTMAETGGASSMDTSAGDSGTGTHAGTGGAPSATAGGVTTSATSAGGGSGTGGTGGTGGAESESSSSSGGTENGEGSGGSSTSAGGAGTDSQGSGGSGGSAGGGGGGSGGSTVTTGGNGGNTYSTNRDDFFGASRCSDEFELCEDFEAESLDTDTWSVRGPAPTIDATRAARGSRSAHFHTVDNGLSYIEQTLTFPAAGNRYFARMFVYFDSMPTAPEWAHWSIAGANGSGTDAEIRVGGQYDNVINRFGVGSDYGPTGDWTILDEDPSGSPLEVPVGEWICVEWSHDGGAHETRFYWDGLEHPSLFTSADDHGGDDTEQYLLPEFESVWVGWWLYQPDTVPGEFDVWIDEVVFDDERVGCDR